MDRIKILDCTLRDGGYINNWDFGASNISRIISGLLSANIDYVECGFLSDAIDYNKNKTLFNSIEQINNLTKNKKNICFMINYGDFDINNLTRQNENLLTLRLAFKKHQINEAFDFCKKAQEKNYKISLNPMHTTLYEEDELLTLIDMTNELELESITVVDTMGIMTKNDTIEYFNKLDKKIKNSISLGFHTHNNLNLSKENIVEIINLKLNRNIIIDSCISGMSRGAGTIPTQDLAKLLNTSNNKYNVQTLEKIGQTYINPIKNENSWGYQLPFLLSAKNLCHPNYANYLIKSNISEDLMEEIFHTIPDKNKQIYSEEIIKEILVNKL